MSTNNFKLDTTRKSAIATYLKGMLKAVRSGKGLWSMVWEIARLTFGPGKVQAEDYFKYELYDDERYTPEAKLTFISGGVGKLPYAWREISQDKPTMTALLEGLGSPVPETQAVVHPTRTFAGSHALRNREDIRRFLREDAEYPIFGKPIDSVCSLGTANIRSYDAGQDLLVLSNGETTSIDFLIDQIEELGSKYLFQSLLLPHPEIVPLIGGNVSTVRMFVLSDSEGCVLLRASWKIPVGNGADNFWRDGNCLAGIDVETGKIVRAVQRVGDDVVEIKTHPVTGVNFDEVVFPEWEAMREVVLQAANNLPDCYFQGWDVALTDKGPVLVELEGDGGDPMMEQLCFHTGLLQGRYKKFIEGIPALLEERKAKAKAHVRKQRKKNFGELAPLWKKSVTSTPETIDPEEVREALQPEGVNSEQPQETSA